MKTLSVTLVVWLLALIPLLAQNAVVSSSRFDVRINAGSAFTFVPAFNNQVLVNKDGAVIPGLFTPANSKSPLITTSAETRTESAAGWYAEGELYYKLPNNFGLSLGVGIKKLRFDHSTTIFNGTSAAVDLDNIDKASGKTNLLYLSATPFNISKRLLKNKLEIQAGPVFNWLLTNEVNNVLIVYYTPEAQENQLPDQMSFNTVGNMRKMIWGFNAAVSYHIVGPLSAKASAQYHVSSLYKDEAWGLKVDKVSSFVIQAGAMLAPFRF